MFQGGRTRNWQPREKGPGAGGGGGGLNNPRSKEDRPWKHIEKILVDTNLFPQHLKPAAIIIGVKGCNHTRMQEESGCCVQLRGIGISSPGTPGSDEPMHLWIKYDTPDQLAKVRDVFQDIIIACQRAHNYDPSRREQTRTPLRTAQPPPINLSNLPSTLPPKPPKSPNSPLECFFTIHYLAHARPGILTQDFAVEYEKLFGYELDPRLSQLAGNLTSSLAMLPQIVSVRPTANQQHVVEPVLPIGISWPLFQAHVNRSAAQPPPPPPQAQPVIQKPALIDVRNPNRPALIDVRNPNKPAVINILAQPTLPSPPCLLVQALHALLFNHATEDIQHSRGPYAERLRNWPGRPLRQVQDEFQQLTGIVPDGSLFGFGSFEQFLSVSSTPEIFELISDGKEVILKLGLNPIDPDFTRVDQNRM